MEEKREQPCTFHTYKPCKFCLHHICLDKTKTGSDPFMCAFKTPEVFKCPICVFDTNLKVDLVEHFRMFHEDKEANKEQDNILKCYRCKKCDFETHSVLVLTKHDDECHMEIKCELPTGLQNGKRQYYDLDPVDSDFTTLLDATTTDETTSSWDVDLNPKIKPCQVMIERLPLNLGKCQLSPYYKTERKKHACFFCGKLFSNITPHLECVHGEESEVKRFSILPCGDVTRKKIIDTLRKKGNFKYNLTDEGKLKPILCRRPQKNKPREKTHYKPCPLCKGFFSVLTLRKHFKHCNDDKSGGRLNVMILSRKMYYDVHKTACKTLAKEVFPPMREDEITHLARFDPLIVAYGNKLCERYKRKHLYYMIRNKLRIVARFFKEIKKLDENISYLREVFCTKYYDICIVAIQNVAGFDKFTGKFSAPATAFNLGIILKCISRILISECVKEDNIKEMRRVEMFLKLLEEDVQLSINQIVSENQKEFKMLKSDSRRSSEEVEGRNRTLNRIRNKNVIRENNQNRIEEQRKELNRGNNKEGNKGRLAVTDHSALAVEARIRNKATSITWSREEISVASVLLNKTIASGKLPSAQECRTLIKENIVLQKRTHQQLKVWVHNNIVKRKKMQELKMELSATEDNRKKWRTPEKVLLGKVFIEEI